MQVLSKKLKTILLPLETKQLAIIKPLRRLLDS